MGLRSAWHAPSKSTHHGSAPDASPLRLWPWANALTGVVTAVLLHMHFWHAHCIGADMHRSSGSVLLRMVSMELCRLWRLATSCAKVGGCISKATNI